MYSDASISTASIFSRIRGMLEKDLNVIYESLAESTDEQSKELLESLREYKQEQLNKLPGKPPVNESIGTPMSGMKNFSYVMTRNTLTANDPHQLVVDLLEAEKSQYQYLQPFDKTEGMPKELLKKLQAILKAYYPVIEQLDLMRSTGRVNSITL